MESTGKVNIWGSKKEPALKEERSESKKQSTSNYRKSSKTQKIWQVKDKSDKAEKYVPRERKHNVVIVRRNMGFKTLVVIAKDMLKKQFDMIELHAVDDKSFLTITLVTNCLMKYKYVTMSRIKTKTVQTIEHEQKKEGDIDHFTRLQPRLVIHLAKTSEFDSIYDDFESQFKKMVEEHQDDIAESEAPGQPSVDQENIDISVDN